MPKEFDNLVETIKKSLKKTHPEWDEKRIESASYGTATNVWKKKYGVNP